MIVSCGMSFYLPRLAPSHLSIVVTDFSVILNHTIKVASKASVSGSSLALHFQRWTLSVSELPETDASEANYKRT